jgi:hypothetical protein
MTKSIHPPLHKLRRIMVDGAEDKIEILGPSLVILTVQEATNFAVAINREATKAKHDFITYLTRELSE